MGYLLDTNVISEQRRKNCDRNVMSFMQSISSGDAFLSALTIGEIVYGISKDPDVDKSGKLAVWLDGLLDLFEGRIIPVDIEIMVLWGKIRARQGRTLPVIDSILAATALANGLTLVTRNAKDFKMVEDLPLLNPWD